MWSVIKSHFHKGKTGFFITGIFVILSVLMMIVGLSICLGMNDLYYNARQLSNSADMVVYLYEKNDGELVQRVIEKINAREDIESYDTQKCMWMHLPQNDENFDFTIYMGESNTNSIIQSNFYNIDDSDFKYKPYVRDEVQGEGFKLYVTGNYTTIGHIGDKVIFKYDGVQYNGYVAGIFDDMCRIYDYAYYVDNQFFEMLTEFSKTSDCIVEETAVGVRFTHKNRYDNAKAQTQLGNEIVKVIQDYNYEQLMQNPMFKVVGGGYSERFVFENSTRPFIVILGAAMVAFSIIVAIIVAVAIGFLVRSSVMDEVRNLGVFKALGYTTNMLRLSYLAIYAVISGVCMLIGIILGITLMPNFVSIITSMARLECSRAIGLNVGSIFAAIALIVAVVGGVVMLATGRVKRVTTLSAMRNNVQTHCFKRNMLPLSKAKTPINVSLGTKSVVSEVNRSVMVVVVVMIMTFLLSFVSVVYFNLKVDQTSLIQMTAIENPDYIISLRYDDNTPYYDAIRNMDGYTADMMSELRVGSYLDDGDWVSGRYYERFDILRTNMVSSGRYPQHSNEILLNENLAKQKGYDIGDSITLHIKELGKDEVLKQCVVVGYFQALFENYHIIGCADMVAYLITPELLVSAPRYFYFEPGKVPTYDEITQALRAVNNEEYINYGSFMTGRANLENMILNTIETAADAVMSVFISVTIIIITLLLIMLIKLKLLREKRNYAIYKALGYTTPNIMTQIAVAMLILGVIGSVIGALVGALSTTPLLTLFGGMLGIGKFLFAVNWWYIAAIIIAVPALVYAVTMLCAVPVRRIAPATLLRERG